ncbi:MAG TPA: AMP-binding protein, partial [Thermoanaerobaculia bacterium]|nr:AMP-binding protein [Thermoanaerobaculia bacterium]
GLDPEALVLAVRDLAARHPALRASVVETAVGPRQRVGREPRLDCAVLDLSRLAPEAVSARIARDAHRPFDLARGPLIRLVLYRRRGGWDFLLALHHLIADLGSFEVIARELGLVYAARTGAGRAELPEPPDYEAWVAAERRRLEGEDGEALAAWWEEALPAEPPPLALPADRPRPALQGFLGHTVAARLGPDTALVLRRFARRHRASLSTLLLAGFQALLHRLTGQDRLAVGVPTAGRGSRETAGLVGYLVNPVVVAGDVAGAPTFAEHLESTRRRLVAAVAHRDYPFPLLARRLRPERDPSRPPVFQAMFVHQRVRGGGLGTFALALPGARLDLGGAVVSPLRLPGERTQMDVQLSSVEVREGPAAGLALELLVAAAPFDRTTARRWLGALDVLLEAAVAAPETPVAELPLLTPGERAAVTTEWASGEPPFPGAPALHRAFAARAAEVPDRLAVVGGGEALSYGELARRVRRGAARLSALGAGPEARIAVCLERSPALVSALLSVLEAGAAYVPVDPALPEARRRLVLRDSGAIVLVTRSGDAPAPPLRRLGPEELTAGPGDGGTLRAPSDPGVDPESLAYLIFTSGSTGTPKAVGIRHGGAAALVAWAGEAYRPHELDRVLAATSVGFDISVFEVFVPLARGGTVVLAGSILDFAHLPERHRVTLLNTVPSALEELIRLRPLPPSVAAVNLAGEPLPEALAEAVRRQLPGVRLWNLYAPSESTTYSTRTRVGPGGGAPTIGRPLRGERAHVVDGRLAPVPVGVAGELVLGGAG